MCAQFVGQMRSLGACLLQDLVAAYDATVHLVYENLAPKLPGLARLVASDDLGVLLKQAQQLLGSRKVLSFKDTASRLGDPLLYQRQEVLKALQKAPSPNIVVLLPQRFDDFSSLSTACLGDGDELLVGLFELLTSFLAFFASDPVESLSCAPDAAIASAEGFLAQLAGNFGRQPLLRPPEQAREHPDPVSQQGTVGGVVDVGLHHRGVHPHLTPAGDLRRARQFHRPIVEGGERLRTYLVRPPDQGGVVRGTLQV